MASYFFNINVDENGYNEVHKESCSYLPSLHNRIYLGIFAGCFSAITYAERQYPSKTFDGCYYCSNECHKG